MKDGISMKEGDARFSVNVKVSDDSDLISKYESYRFFGAFITELKKEKIPFNISVKKTKRTATKTISVLNFGNRAARIARRLSERKPLT